MESLLSLYTHVDLLMLIFCRIFFALIFLPIIVETKLPAIAKGGIVLALTYIVFLTGPEIHLEYGETLLGFFMLVIKEALIGLIMGFGVLIFFQIYYFIGHLWSIQGGIGLSTVLDVNSGMQMPIIGKLYYLGFATIFLVSGGYHWFITSVVESFTYIPIGKGILRGEILYPVVEAIGTFFLLGFKLAAPIVAVLFIIDCGLGILARTVPQMNMFVIGLPLKIIILFLLLLMSISLLPLFNDLIINQMIETFFNITQGLVP